MRIDALKACAPAARKRKKSGRGKTSGCLARTEWGRSPASRCVAFASAPLPWITYFPIYGLLWALLVLPWLAERKLISGRLRVLGFGLLLLAATGAPLYVGATVATSARGAEAPALLHPGWELLRPAFWRDLLSEFAVCDRN